MEKFIALPEKKKNAIIDAALAMFGKMGYKKTSAMDIATEAGISKSMLFHYFGSKKNLYVYLIEYSMEIMMDALNNALDTSTSDFFERVLGGTKVKLEVMRKHPSLSWFLTSVYFETDSGVTKERNTFLQLGCSYRNKFALDDLDTHKFKDSVKPELVLKLLVKYAEGYVGNVPVGESLDLDAMIEEFTECVAMMKNNFYREEYLNEHN